jgi:septal ring factor EnvC (AmiA/AmiB activator)
MTVRGFPAPSALAIAAILLATGSGLVAAQAPADIRREIVESQRRLEQIRAERERLEREMGDVRNQVRDVSAELANVERRLSASRSVLAEVEFQSDATSAQIEETSRNLLRARERMA